MRAATATPGSTPDATPGHKRNRSAPALKGILLAKSHKRTTSEDPKSPSRPRKENSNPYNPFAAASMPSLPPDHPHAGQNVLNERHHTNAQSPPKKTGPGRPGLHKKTKSVASLRELVGSRDGKGSNNKDKSSSGSSSSNEDKKRGVKAAKTKSSANLVAVFGKSRVSKFEEDLPQPPKDKENTTPPSSSGYTPHTPIWAQFASQPLLEHKSTTKIPLKDGHSVKDEIALYMPRPQDCSPSKQRNFYDIGQPTLGKKDRPKSDGLMSKPASNFMETLSRKRSNKSGKNKVSVDDKQGMRGGDSGNETKAGASKPSSSASNGTMSRANKGSRVKAAVTMFDRKARQAEAEASLDPKQIDAAFETVLVSGNHIAKVSKILTFLRMLAISQKICARRCVPLRPASKQTSSSHTGRKSQPQAPNRCRQRAQGHVRNPPPLQKRR